MKYCGMLGFAVSQENPAGSGIWTETITEKTYYGDVNRFAKKSSGSNKVIEDIDISNEISILMDPFLSNNLTALRYVTWMNTKWKVTSIDIQYPRCNLSIGGVYNG